MGDASATTRVGQDDLVDRIANGDRVAETEFVRRYATGIRALVRRHTRPNDPIVDDIVQDVLGNVLQKLREGALRDGEALPAYVRSAVIFAAQAEYRQRKVSHAEPLPADVEQIAGTDNPVDVAERHIVRTLIAKLMQELPVNRDRELLVRFYLHDQSKEDICRELDLDESHFRRVLFRARDRLVALCRQAGLRGQP